MHFCREVSTHKKIKNTNPSAEQGKKYTDGEGLECSARKRQNFLKTNRRKQYSSAPIEPDKMNEPDKTRYEWFKYVFGKKDIPLKCRVIQSKT